MNINQKCNVNWNNSVWNDQMGFETGLISKLCDLYCRISFSYMFLFWEIQISIHYYAICIVHKIAREHAT